ncbi:LPS export ABC transporter permease LptF [Rhodoblastus acidophilus]|uniref:LPS export ABC transporter permease LptF n=1 Tax=Candidatus Rhodoblastus alkanivorans TaxID=2954117 RepID=A0ABS9Z789_9HYPH|nr:LPS export ABC transporter permease LptF [Candidatus Rhodoblastus alkanivorans]MCI4678747.1 LPS export ABC transporter permease LptF [Candidatus Rhodoblastus alkanivorans]MCI4683457.1 LPS export ABC transporter permease LptF [Candidatus Rhodoblastus alkanivorans]MDI4640771.1 LPS export ABC transporter permease LptF [Rhodoblastus acidophilus]
MSLVERYIFKISGSAFLIALGVLTAVIWLTQAMRDFDLMTTKGQSLIVFFHITGLIIPSLLMVISPIALFIATVFALNKLNGDSELVVAASAGLSPFQLFRPFAALIVAGSLFCGVMSLWAMPWSFRALRYAISEVHTDFLTRIVRPGAFNGLDYGLYFHYRERGPGGALLGIFMLDQREPGQSNVYLAERGIATKVGDQNYLVLQTGTIQRQDKGSAAPAIVMFDSYALDLDRFGSRADSAPLRPRERSTWDLLHYDTSEPYVKLDEGHFRAELHERFTAPLYALAMGMIAFAALGAPRTTRQNRGVAIGAAVLAALLLRVGGFGASALMAREASAVPLAYALPLGGAAVAALYAFRSAFRHPFGRARAVYAAA